VVSGSVPYNALELEIRGGRFETLGLKKLHDYSSLCCNQ
jgi:hypothetical protein